MQLENKDFWLDKIHNKAGEEVIDMWPEPEIITVSLKPVEKLPLNIIPKPFQAWVYDTAFRMQCPLEFPAVSSIVQAGAIIGTGCGIRPKQKDDWLVVPNLWGVIIARPSFLKSPLLNAILKPIQRLELEAKEVFAHIQKCHEAEEEVFKAQKEAIKKEIRAAAQAKNQKAGKKMDDLKMELISMEMSAPPARKRFITNDSTVEKMGELLNENPRGILLFRDELIGLLCSWDREDRKQDRAFYLESWNGQGTYVFDRIGRGTIDIGNCCVSILGGIQPSKLEGYLHLAVNDIANDGMLQRFQLMVYPDEGADWKYIDQDRKSVV